MNSTKQKKDEQPRVHEKLKGFSYDINAFGELSSSLSIDQINQFLNENSEDKKLSTDQISKNKRARKQ